MVVAVAIERRQVELAMKLAKQIEAVVRGRNYTGLESQHRFFYGYCGEAAVVNWLRHEGVRFRHLIDTSGRSSNNEIYVAQDGARRHLEVKTASHPHHKTLMIPAIQREPAAFYVAVRLEADPLKLLDNEEPYCAASIMGWLTGDEVARLDTKMVRIKTKCADFMSLHHPNALVRQLDQGPEIVHGE